MTDPPLVIYNTNAWVQPLAKEVPKPLIKGPNHGKESLYMHFMHFLHFSPQTSFLGAFGESTELNRRLA